MTELGSFATKLRDVIDLFVRESPANRLPASELPYFDGPLVGFAPIDDPLFTRYRKIIGDFHLTPGELMESAFGPGSGDRGTVVCWILPICEHIRASNRPERFWPSREWAYARDHGEKFNSRLRQYVADHLTAMGHRAVAPLLTELCRMVETPAGPSSTWSERHAAFAAGLGTFSLNDGFITERGIAHRCGSVITDLVLEPTPRRYRHHAENCLYCRDGSCGACMGRCPAGAISAHGHDKKKCHAYCYGDVVREVGGNYGVASPGCGLCQTAVPCEAGIP